VGVVLLLGVVDASATTVALTPTRDAWVLQNDPDRNVGAFRMLWLEGRPPRTRRPLLLFDVSSIPAGAVVTSAVLTLEKIAGDNLADTVSVHALTRVWTEGDNSDGSGVTWSTYDGVRPWTTAGGDFDPVPAATTRVPSGDGPKSWSIPGLVQAWVDGTVPNHGVVLRALPEAGRKPRHGFSSREGAVPPVLAVTYTVFPQITLAKSWTTASDPVHGALNPKAIPGASVLCTITGSNEGPGTADSNSVVVIDAIPAETSLFVGDLGGAGSGPVLFTDGAVSSGLSYTYGGLSDPADDVDFSDDGGATFAYVPSPGADGVDPSVTHLRVHPEGELAASDGTGHPTFLVSFRVRVE